jgi:hypothetical protein
MESEGCPDQLSDVTVAVHIGRPSYIAIRQQSARWNFCSSVNARLMLGERTDDLQPFRAKSWLPMGRRQSEPKGQITRDKRRTLLFGEIDKPMQEPPLRLELKAQSSPQSEVGTEKVS